MNDKRASDRRKKTKIVKTNRRKGPRRLVCGCGGRVDAIISKSGKESFVCLRCGSKT